MRAGLSAVLEMPTIDPSIIAAKEDFGPQRLGFSAERHLMGEEALMLSPTTALVY